MATVKNNSSSTIKIGGVSIKAGQSGQVPNWDDHADNRVIAKWMEKPEKGKPILEVSSVSKSPAEAEATD